MLWLGLWQFLFEWCSHFGKHLPGAGSVHVDSALRGPGPAELLGLNYTPLGGGSRKGPGLLGRDVL